MNSLRGKKAGRFLRMAGFGLLIALNASFASAAETVPVPAGPAPAPEDPWQTRLPAFSVDGPARGEGPILLYFTAGWCGFCKQMDRTTLSDPEVQKQLGGLRAHKIDFDAQGGLVERFGVRGIPAFVLTNDRGEVIDRLTGASARPDFLRWLEQGGAAFARRIQTDAMRAEILRTLPTDIRSSDAPTRAGALETLWRLAGRGDEVEHTGAIAILTAVIGEAGAGAGPIWRIGLGHTDLAIRVAAANLLRQLTDARKAFDPWAEEAERTAALAALGY